MSLNRVVITGCGTVGPLGASLPEMMSALDAGARATRAITTWNRFGQLRCQVGAPAAEVDAKLIPRQYRRTMSRMSISAVHAALEALAHADLAREQILNQPRFGCVMGSTTGSPNTLTETYATLFTHQGYTQLGAAEFFHCVSHTVALNVAQYFGIKGMVQATSAACASGLQAVGTAADLIRLGRQDLVLCGGADELHETVVGSFDILFAASARYNDCPERTPRPFDRQRDGIVCGEGAGVLVLESLDHARRRNANILAEVLGYHTCSNGIHVSQSDDLSMAACMSTALANANLAPADIGYISAHATGTVQGDIAEARAISAVLGGDIPASSLKGNLGHTLGASGAIELAATIEMMQRGVVYPTVNLDEIDPECAGVRHVREKLAHPFSAFLKNSFAFGGINGAIVCSKVRP